MINIILVKKKFNKGETIFSEGDPGGEAYIIRHGYVTIIKSDGDREIELATRGPGEIVGEMALIDERPRSATLKAKTDMEMEIMTRKELVDMLDHAPEPIQLMIHQLLDRLRDMNELAAMNS